MRKELFDKMCCPFDHSDLELTVIKEEEGRIIEGLMKCEACSRYFPIIHSIPVMSPDEYRQKELEAPVLKKWGLQVSAGEEKFVLTAGGSTGIS